MPQLVIGQHRTPGFFERPKNPRSKGRVDRAVCWQANKNYVVGFGGINDGQRDVGGKVVSKDEFFCQSVAQNW